MQIDADIFKSAIVYTKLKKKPVTVGTSFAEIMQHIVQGSKCNLSFLIQEKDYFPCRLHTVSLFKGGYLNCLRMDLLEWV